jgi:hypothetical protein
MGNFCYGCSGAWTVISLLGLGLNSNDWLGYAWHAWIGANDFGCHDWFGLAYLAGFWNGLEDEYHINLGIHECSHEFILIVQSKSVY